MINVINDVRIFEINDENSYDDGVCLTVLNHRNDPAFVVLQYDSKKIAILKNELIAAINNATNTGQY